APCRAGKNDNSRRSRLAAAQHRTKQTEMRAAGVGYAMNVPLFFSSATADFRLGDAGGGAQRLVFAAQGWISQPGLCGNTRSSICWPRCEQRFASPTSVARSSLRESNCFLPVWERISL